MCVEYVAPKLKYEEEEEWYGCSAYYRIQIHMYYYTSRGAERSWKTASSTSSQCLFFFCYFIGSASLKQACGRANYMAHDLLPSGEQVASCFQHGRASASTRRYSLISPIVIFFVPLLLLNIEARRVGCCLFSFQWCISQHASHPRAGRAPCIHR